MKSGIRALALVLVFARTLSAAPLQVIQRSPSGEMDSLNSAREIVATFNQPMVALGDNADLGSFCPIQLSPSAPGRCRWRGTNTAVFEVQGPLKPGAEYHVTVSRGTGSQVSGDKLAEDAAWSFITPRPRLTASAPTQGERWIALDAKLFLAFDQKMDPDKAKDFLALEEVAAGEPDPTLDPQAVAMKGGALETLRDRGFGSAQRAPDSARCIPLAVAAIDNAHFKALLKQGALGTWNRRFWGGQADQVFVLSPARAMRPEHRYRLWILQGLPGAEGGVGTLRTQLVAFDTWTAFGALGVADPGGCVAPAGKQFKGAAARAPLWAFSNPVDPASFFQHLSISPPPPAPKGAAEQAEPSDGEGEGDDGEEDGGSGGGYTDQGSYVGVSFHFGGPSVSGQAVQLSDRDLDQDGGERARFGLATTVTAREVSLQGLRLKVGQTYHFELSAGLKDAFGNALPAPEPFDLTVPDYCAELDVPNGFSVLESYLKPRHPADGLNVKDWPVSLWNFSRDQYVPAMEYIEQGQYLSQPAIEFPGPPPLNTRWSMEAAANVLSRSYIDLGQVLRGAAGGLVGFSIPGIHDARPFKGLDNLTDLGVTLKTAPDSTLVWVTHLKDGRPARGVPVELRLTDNRSVWKGSSDRSGLVLAPGWRALGIPAWDGTNDRPRLYAIAGSPNGDAVMGSGRSTGIEPWRFGIDADGWPQERRHRGLVFTDRGVYRPGETVNVKGVFRALDVDDWGLPRPKELALQLTNAREEVALKKSVSLNERGSFSLSYAIPADAPTGEWRLAVLAIGHSARPHGPNFQVIHEYADFRVEAFKPAAFEVKVQPLQAEAFAGDELKASLEGWYLYGAPMSGAGADWNILFQSTNFSPPGWEDFDFGRGWWEQEDHGEQSGGEGGLTLTAKGQGELSASTASLKLKGPYLARFEAGVTSPDRQHLFGRASMLVHPASYYVGSKLDARVIESGQRLPVSIIVTDTQGRAVPGVRVHGKARRREHVSVRRVGMGGRLTWENSSKDVQLPAFELLSGYKPVEWDFTPDKPGEYYLDLEVTDPSGRVNQSASMVYVAGPGQSWWDQEDHDLIQLVADKKAYKVGDEAKILVQSPWEHAQALVTVERETVMDSWTVELKDGASLVTVPIKEGYLPNAFVSVVVVRGRLGKDSYDDEGLDLSKPQARFGYVNLPVEPAGRRLSVAIDLDKQDYRPGDSVNAALHVKDAAGKGEATELTVWAVDEGVLQLTDYQTPDLFNAFYGPRPLYIWTADTRLHVLGQRSYGEKGQDRGGGGGEPLEGIDLRSDFRFSALWTGTLMSDADGEAKVHFKLPDNLSAFRLMVAAHTLKRFGKGQRRFTVSKPLMLRPSLPRFARLGDQFQGGVVVHNNSAKDASVELQIKAGQGSALGLSGPARRKVDVPAGKAVEVLWPISAQRLGDGALEIRAKATLDQPETDGLAWKLPVTVPEKLQTVASSGVCEGSVTETVRLPGSRTAGQGDFTATFSSSALSGLRGGVSYLLDYPYGCLEQKLSRILPVVVGAQILEGFKLQDLSGQKTAAQDVLSHLADFQCGSGGYTYWTGCGGESGSPYLTAYALEVAKLAQAQGYSVPEESLSRARDWLKGVFDEHQNWDYPYSQSELMVMRAYALDALSLYDTSPTGYLSQLYGRRDQLPFLAKAHLLKAAKRLSSDPSVAATLAQELLNQAKVDARSLHFEEPENERMEWVHGSTVQATAVCLEALLSAQGGFSGDEKAVAWLTGERKDLGRWRNTQENAWGLRAFSAFFNTHEAAAPDFQAGLTLARPGAEQTLWARPFQGRSLDVDTKTLPLDQLFAGGDEARLNITRQGQGRLYYGMTMTYAPRHFGQSDFEGFEVERSVKDLETGAAADGVLVAGRRYVVTLTVRSRQDRTFVALVDPLPGGVEVVNDAFANAGDSKAAAAGLGAKGWWDSFQHSESYDDREQVFANFLTQGEHQWRYLVQATTPGHYAKPAAWVEQMYEPEVFGRCASAEVEVRPAP